MMKELVTKKSSIVSEVTRYYIGDFRGTEGSQKFVMDPYDPQQFEDEAIPTIAAHYRSAVEHYAVSVGRDDIDSQEVYNAMRERAVYKISSSKDGFLTEGRGTYLRLSHISYYIARMCAR
jgi:hypothetical protein